MSKFDYRPKFAIQAVQWIPGVTLDDMKEMLADVVSRNEWDGVEVYQDWIEPYNYFDKISGGGYYILKFYAGDDYEVDPGRWVVLHEDGEVEILDELEFSKLYEKSN